MCDQLVVREGVLYREYEEEGGSGSHQEILQDMHGGVLGGHLGAKKTLSRLKRGSTGLGSPRT